MNKRHTKTTTPQQRAANRRNSRRSTGPRTREGKARSRLNALKHGLLAHETLAQGLCIRESADDLHRLRRQFFEHCAPVGPIEEMLVEQIVACHWRKRRVLRAESGEVALSVDGGIMKRVQMAASRRALWDLGRGERGESRLKQSTAGLDYMMETLQDVRTVVQGTGGLDKPTQARVLDVFGVEWHGVTATLRGMERWRRLNPRRVEKATLRAEYQQEVEAYVAERLEEYGYRRQVVEATEAMEATERERADALPDAATLLKIQRYEGALDRQLFRLLQQLDHWQQRRLKDQLPAPVKLAAGLLVEEPEEELPMPIVTEAAAPEPAVENGAEALKAVREKLLAVLRASAAARAGSAVLEESATSKTPGAVDETKPNVEPDGKQESAISNGNTPMRVTTGALATLENDETKPNVGGEKTEVGGGKTEVRSQNPEERGSGGGSLTAT